MKERKFGVITFKSTHYAIKGNSIFKKENINFRTIPTRGDNPQLWVIY